jgi:hypothetical protein
VCGERRVGAMQEIQDESGVKKNDYHVVVNAVV